jgi:hypothetical protein
MAVVLVAAVLVPVLIVRLLRQADAQLFAGWETYPCLVDEEVLEALARLSWKMSRCLAGEDSIILLSGAWTSGRIAYSLCQDFNRQLREARLRERDITLVLTDEAADFIARAAYDPVYGARPIKRYLQREVETRLGRAILAGQIVPGSAVEIVVDDGKLSVRTSPTQTPAHMLTHKS